ncbi:uncharacterized protein LOC119174121 [Rhipicephalus microplus]|uniref:uncharacterized protein LOC119174121 n=1 Tax=Rhipicephalus microplus TaxID=6941 RepID=UPI003F6B257D
MAEKCSTTQTVQRMLKTGLQVRDITHKIHVDRELGLVAVSVRSMGCLRRQSTAHARRECTPAENATELVNVEKAATAEEEDNAEEPLGETSESRDNMCVPKATLKRSRDATEKPLKGLPIYSERGTTCTFTTRDAAEPQTRAQELK